MKIKADEATQRQLVLVKQLYLHAVEQSIATSSDLQQIMAIIEFDLANETLLKAVADTFSTQVKHPKNPHQMNFHDLTSYVNDVLKELKLGTVPDERKIKLIHDSRNSAQHRALPPNIAELEPAKVHTKDFLTTFMDQIWQDMDFERLSLATRIKHSKIKAYLLAAEGALQVPDYPEAAKKAALGLEQALALVKTPTVGNDVFRWSASSSISDTRRGEGYDELRDTITALIKNQNTMVQTFPVLQRMQTALLFATLGMNYNAYRDFRRLIPTISIEGDFVDFRRKNEDPNIIADDDAERIVAYCINTILQVEKQVGDLTKPFGVEF